MASSVNNKTTISNANTPFSDANTPSLCPLPDRALLFSPTLALRLNLMARTRAETRAPTSAASGSTATRGKAGGKASQPAEPYPLRGSTATCDGCCTKSSTFYHCGKCWADAAIAGSGAFALCESCYNKPYAEVKANFDHNRRFPTHPLQLVEPVGVQDTFAAGSRVHVPGFGRATVIRHLDANGGQFANKVKIEYDSGETYHVSAAALVLLSPESALAPSASAASGAGGAPFIATAAFNGVRKGYVYRLGAKGRGYYVDPASAPAPAPAPAMAASASAASGAVGAPFIATATFDGIRKGYVWKQGAKGCGYYAGLTASFSASPFVFTPPSPKRSARAADFHTPTLSAPVFSIGTSNTFDTSSGRRFGALTQPPRLQRKHSPNPAFACPLAGCTRCTAWPPPASRSCSRASLQRRHHRPERAFQPIAIPRPRLPRQLARSRAAGGRLPVSIEAPRRFQSSPASALQAPRRRSRSAAPLTPAQRR